MIKQFFSAVQFITVLPLGKNMEFDPRGMIRFFPVVGLLAGGILCLSDLVFMSLWPRPVVAVLDVLVLIFITGAFHVDGLGDTADGIFSHRSKEKALLIMKDSRIGAMGLVAVISVLAVKWGGLMSLDSHRTLFLFLIPAYSRGSMLFGMKYLKYGRPEGGTGHSFFEAPLKPSDFSFLWIPVTLSFLSGFSGLWLNIVYFVSVFLILYFYKKKLDCITGDMLGAMVEVTEALLFLLVAAGGI